MIMEQDDDSSDEISLAAIDAHLEKQLSDREHRITENAEE